MLCKLHVASFPPGSSGKANNGCLIGFGSLAAEPARNQGIKADVVKLNGHPAQTACRMPLIGHNSSAAVGPSGLGRQSQPKTLNLPPQSRTSRSKPSILNPNCMRNPGWAHKASKTGIGNAQHGGSGVRLACFGRSELQGRFLVTIELGIPTKFAYSFQATNSLKAPIR